jgi:hypothetical protein
MAPAMRREFGERITALVINLPRLGVDAYENRLDIEGFRYKGDDSRDEDLHDVWQANDMDEQSQQATWSRWCWAAPTSASAPETPPTIRR